MFSNSPVTGYVLLALSIIQARKGRGLFCRRLQPRRGRRGSAYISSSDFTLLKATFSKSIGQPGYDDRADFDGNQVVNAPDFTLLKSNFGIAGSPPLGP